MNNLIERIKSVAGQDFDSYGCRVRNPHITARQSIEIADYIVGLEQERDKLAAQVESLRGEAEPVGYLHKIPNRIPVFFESKEEAIIQGCDVFPVYATTAALKAQWQAEAVRDFADECDISDFAEQYLRQRAQEAGDE